MTEDELLDRLCRIYASIKGSIEFDMAKLPARIIKAEHTVAFVQDFAGGQSEHEIANLAHTLIHNIASLQDHLRRWAATNGKDKTKVDEIFDNSPELQLITDLWNNDKHGYPPRDGGQSGKAPKLVYVRRQMRLKTKPTAGSFVAMTFGPRGVPKITGDGSANAVVTGDVVDRNGVLIGDLFDIEQQAVETWERLLREFGVVM